MNRKPRNWLHEQRRKPVPRQPAADFEQVKAWEERRVFGILVGRLASSADPKQRLMAKHWRDKAYVWLPRTMVAAARQQVANTPTGDAKP